MLTHFNCFPQWIKTVTGNGDTILTSISKSSGLSDTNNAVVSKFRFDSIITAVGDKQTKIPGGTTNQYLKKVSNGEGDFTWATISGGGDLLAANNLSDVQSASTARTNLGVSTTANISNSTNKNFVTDAQLSVIGNTSGTNTGDQTSVSGNAGTATTLQTTRNIDGIAFNGSADILTTQWIRLSSTYTLTSQTALQKLFNSTTNGAFTAASSTAYFFECVFDLSSMSATSGNFQFGFLGTATFTSISYMAIASKTALTAATAQNTTFKVATASVLTSSNTTTTGHARISGIINVNAGGTIIPAVGLSIAAAAVVGINSRFSITPIGTNTQTSTGNFN